MGDHKVNTEADKSTHTQFIRHILDDIRSMELMLEKGLIESGISRIGAEQEFCLVNDNWRPATNFDAILEAVDDPHFTTELARYQLEINLDPFELTGDCFSKVEDQLSTLLRRAAEAAKANGSKIVLTGILPTISKNQLGIAYMTPNPRYYALNDIMHNLRGGDFRLKLRGVDELSLKHDSVLFEACNTSFQMHLQISPEDFVSSFNWAQAISGPVLGVCTNSPLLLGRELWSETRIALFQQSVDTRSSAYELKDQQARVTFGQEWQKGSVADIFKNDLTRFKVILTRDIESNSMEELKAGRVPKLAALNLHNGTIYRWNRPCYGVGGGKAHVRIENRYIPAGPTIADQMANFALWVGLMMGRPKEFDNMSEVMDFKDAKANFIKAARNGKESVLLWREKQISVRDLMLKELIPIAWTGLQKAGVSKEDARRLLAIIEQRTKGQTGSQWIVRNYRELCKKVKRDHALLSLTKAIHDNQMHNTPVHEWKPISGVPEAHQSAHLVGHIMSTQLFTINQNDLAELAINMMEWKEIHHVPVVDNNDKLTGLLTWTHIQRFKDQNRYDESLAVSDIMTREVKTATTTTEIKDAISVMKANEIGCLPVVHEDHLIGIITISDVIAFDNDRGI